MAAAIAAARTVVIQLAHELVKVHVQLRGQLPLVTQRAHGLPDLVARDAAVAIRVPRVESHAQTLNLRARGGGAHSF